jgi:hypothetical protein
LLDLPPALNSPLDIPDSVTDLLFVVDIHHLRRGTRATFCFGPDSRLESVCIERLASGVKKCFLQLASRAIKRRRDRREFDVSSLSLAQSNPPVWWYPHPVSSTAAGRAGFSRRRLFGVSPGLDDSDGE